MFRLICESMLAKVIAFEEAGVPLQELKQSVGRDGGMLIGRGVVLHTPIAQHLFDEVVKSLIESYSELLGDYNAGRLDRDHIHSLKLRNNITSKVAMIRSNLRKQGRERN